MHYAVANVPLDNLKIEQDKNTGGYTNSYSSWVGQQMMNFYGNWEELQALATLQFEEAQKMSPDDLKKLGIDKLTQEVLLNKREIAIKTQETFLHILRVFAPALVNMQHPNVTLEITTESSKV